MIVQRPVQKRVTIIGDPGALNNTESLRQRNPDGLSRRFSVLYMSPCARKQTIWILSKSDTI